MANITLFGRLFFYLFDHLSSSLDDNGLGLFHGRSDLVVVAQQTKDWVLVPVPTHTQVIYMFSKKANIG